MNSFSLLGSKKYNFGITFSGGGAKCLAQAGFLQYLLEQGIEPDIISGVSGGAIIAALYASGNSPKEILDILLSIRIFSLRNFSFNRLGLINSSKISLLLNKHFYTSTFEGLKIPIKIAVTNLTKGKIEVFSDGEIIKPLAASFAYPGIFTPVKIGQEIYADGGILNNYPSDLICDAAKYNIGMYLAPLTQLEVGSLHNSLDVIERILQINSNTSIQSNIEKVSTIIPFQINKWRPFSTKPEQLKQLFNLGYNATKEHFSNSCNFNYLLKIKKCSNNAKKPILPKFLRFFGSQITPRDRSYR